MSALPDIFDYVYARYLEENPGAEDTKLVDFCKFGKKLFAEDSVVGYNAASDSLLLQSGASVALPVPQPDAPVEQKDPLSIADKFFPVGPGELSREYNKIFRSSPSDFKGVSLGHVNNGS